MESKVNLDSVRDEVVKYIKGMAVVITIVVLFCVYTCFFIYFMIKEWDDIGDCHRSNLREFMIFMYCLEFIFLCADNFMFRDLNWIVFEKIEKKDMVFSLVMSTTWFITNIIWGSIELFGNQCKRIMSTDLYTLALVVYIFVIPLYVTFCSYLFHVYCETKKRNNARVEIVTREDGTNVIRGSPANRNYSRGFSFQSGEV